ncbi:MAG: hypothetical protein U1E89_04620 [Burkholderiaceae bacterium]
MQNEQRTAIWAPNVVRKGDRYAATWRVFDLPNIERALLCADLLQGRLNHLAQTFRLEDRAHVIVHSIEDVPLLAAELTGFANERDAYRVVSDIDVWTSYSYLIPFRAAGPCSAARTGAA